MRDKYSCATKGAFKQNPIKRDGIVEGGDETDGEGVEKGKSFI